MFSKKEILFSREWFFTYAQILLGSVLISASFVFFISPYRLTPGGVYGIATMVHHLYGMYHDVIQSCFNMVIPAKMDMSFVALSMDIPLFGLGVYCLGSMFGVKTICSILALAGSTYVFETVWGIVPIIQDDIMLSAIVGAVVLGLGSSLVFRTNATSGGTDVISMILSRKLKLPLGTMVIVVDSCVVLISFIAFNDIKIPLYSFIIIYITGRIINSTLYGFSKIKTMLIISDKYEEVSKFILELDRGGTILYGEGLYAKSSKKVIFSNVTVKEVNLIHEYIQEIDPLAFITVMDASQVIGEGRGFKGMHE